MISNILKKLLEGNDLRIDEAYYVMDKIMSGELDNIEISAYLVALQGKGESIDEITGSCMAIREHCKRVNFEDEHLVDTCGTGGDGQGTFNISTVSAFVVAGAGIPVAKHGNRAVSGKCGSADLLEELKVDINMSHDKVGESLRDNCFAFLFAPNMHPAMANVMPVRKKLKLRTIFNILGPLNNPAFVKRQVIGVFHKKHTENMAKVLIGLGSKHLLVVSAEDGGDEISLTGKTIVTEAKGEEIINYTVSPEDFGFKRCLPEDIAGGDAGKSAELSLSVLNGEKSPLRHAVILNAGAAIYVSGKASNIKEGIEMAAESIDSKKALNILNSLRVY